MKLSKNQLITVLSFIVLAIGSYVFLPMVNKDKKPKPAAMESTAKETPAFDFTAYLAKVKASVTNTDTTKLIDQWENSNDYNALTLLFHGKGESVVEAYYTAKAGETEKSKEKLERAGDLFEATSGISNSDDMKGYLLEKAVESYQNAYNLDSTNINLRMKYAGSLIEQGASPMQGIAMLLDIVKKDPDNADAQLMLGKFAMMSGQFEKAVVRLEKVISLRPQSNDALFLLAMAYENKGDKGKALEILQKCESREKNPELKKEIGSYIERLKKS